MTNLDEIEPRPEGELTLSVKAEPAVGPNTTGIHAGWIVSQVELASLKAAESATGSSAVTVAIEAMDFVSPVNRGARVHVYTRLKGAGRTSVKVYAEVWVEHGDDYHKVTATSIVLVAIDDAGRARPINQH